ncbi:hypothetical protein BDW62DRAFT_76491 [Aspergillus aurantiobrunneus]
MALRLLKGHTVDTKDSVSIELDKDSIVFQGCEQEALAVYLSGHLTIHVKEPLAVKHIRLHLSGVRRVSLRAPPPAARKTLSSEDEFYKRSWHFHDAYRATPEVLAPGEHKYPFSVLLEGSLPESVEGLKDASIAYSFTAEVGRKHARDLRLQKPLRIIRVPEPWSQEMVLDEVWADKIAYLIEIPNKVVAFGASLDVNYSFLPVLSGLKIAYIETHILEVREFALNESEMDSGRSHSTTAILCSDQYNVDDGAIKTMDGCQFSRSLRLPRTLGECVPDTSARGIRIKHKLVIQVRMHNPEGHDTELRLAIPVSIYLSPYYRAWEGSFTGDVQLPPTLIPGDEPPPPYEEHGLDRVYSPRELLAGSA